MDIQSYFSWGVDYLIGLPADVQSGDLFAIMVALILIYCIIVILKKFTRLVLHSAKKIFILFIILIASYIFFRDFLLRILTEGLTPDNIIFGFTGLLCGILAVGIALYTAVRSIKKGPGHQDAQNYPYPPPGGMYGYPYPYAANGEKEGQAPPQNGEEAPQPIFPFINLTKDNSVGMVIIYLIIAEFGIFSSKTIAASSAEMGFYFFLIFMIAALIFIKLTYHDYLRGFKHFIVVTILGFILSIVLGHFWGGIPLETLLSMQFFGSDALVALITGIALSLFMSSKGG